MSTMLSAVTDSNKREVERDFVQEILSPYREHATYLRSALIDDAAISGGGSPRKDGQKKALMTAFGTFEIHESCYIDDTGHFNAVEFNICFNQLAYVLFAECFRKQLLPKIAPALANKLNMGYAKYRSHQLSSMFIVKYQSRFKQQIDSNLFHGELSVQRVSSMANTFFAHTYISFFDGNGGFADGNILLAFASQAVE